MKKTIFLSMALSASVLHGFAQNLPKTFGLSGTIDNKAIDSVKLSYLSQKTRHIEKAAIQNGAFKFSGAVTEPTPATITFSGKTIDKAIQKSIYLEAGNIGFAGNPAVDSTIRIKGSKTHDEEELYNGLHRPVYAEIKKIGDSLKTEKDPAKIQALKARRELKNKENERINYSFFKSHPDSYISTMMLYMMSAMYPIDSLKMVYEGFTPKAKQFSVGQKIAELIQEVEAVAPGKTATDFTTIDVDGKKLTLSSLRGKYVILDFWASWCVPCRNSHPHLISLYQKYKDKGLDIIGIASDDGRDKIWREAIAKDQVGIWHHTLAGEDPAKSMKGEKSPNSIMGLYGVTALPTKFLIDPNGKILMRMVGDGPEDLDQKLAELLK